MAPYELQSVPLLRDLPLTEVVTEEKAVIWKVTWLLQKTLPISFLELN